MKIAATRSGTPLPILVILLLIGLVAIAAPVLIVSLTPRVVVTKPPRVVISTRIVPRTELPPVEPVELQPVDPDDARSVNAAIPFSTKPNPAARPFRVFGSADSQARAVDCLAAAVYYEAGNDAVGQRAVAQVILNRMRHPAFPKSVCGVVFQGWERSTGCQFTFTCDGAMFRYKPSAASWTRARDVASTALNGSVYAPVGHATHYHTDWVVPYWSSSLEKITEVHTHLFFRWAGWWGTPPAFNRSYTGAEPNIARMSLLSASFSGDPGAPPTPATEPTEASLDPLASVDPESIKATDVPEAMGADPDSFLVTLPKGMNAENFASLAIRTCGERKKCKFMAWSEAGQTPRTLPLDSGQVSTMAFSYLRDLDTGYAKALWNCRLHRRPSPVQCMRDQPLGRPATPAVEAAPTDLEGKPTSPAGLSGVRRREPAAAPAPAPMPSPAAAPVAEPARSGRVQRRFRLPAADPSPVPTPTTR
ncbi:cell wall hydrolase [Sphingomonas sp. HF-S3]|uniref:Cell wall hydrolase n=1 Tax=Sphingomonas rustica TaxID=3103142 RepID=A0ABV0B8H1_9SPHN